MFNRLFVLVFVFSACSACGTDITTGNPIGETPVVPETPSSDGDAVVDDVLANSVLDLVNAQRTAGCRCGNRNLPPVPPLTLNSNLMSAARMHSNDMSAMQSMQHAGSDNSQVGDRVTQTGYQWRAVGENIAWNYRTAEDLVAGWLSSPGHCENIMNASFQEMGLAVSNWYWTQVFAQKR